MVTCVQRKWVWLRPDGPAVFFYTMCRLTDEQALLQELCTLTDDRQSVLPLPQREVGDFAQPVEQLPDSEEEDEVMSDTELAAELQSDAEEEEEGAGATEE